MNLMENKPVIPSMYDCPRFQRCSAPLCPLDPDWRIRSYHRDDPRCRYLCASARADGRAKVPEGILVACDAMAGDPELPESLKKRLKWGEKGAEHIRALKKARQNGMGSEENLQGLSRHP